MRFNMEMLALTTASAQETNGILPYAQVLLCKTIESTVDDASINFFSIHTVNGALGISFSLEQHGAHSLALPVRGLLDVCTDDGAVITKEVLQVLPANVIRQVPDNDFTPTIGRASTASMSPVLTPAVVSWGASIAAASLAVRSGSVVSSVKSWHQG